MAVLRAKIFKKEFPENWKDKEMQTILGNEAMKFQLGGFKPSKKKAESIN